MDFMEEFKDLKRTVERHSDRLAVIESNHAKDHETLGIVKKDVDEMKVKINKVEKDVETMLRAVSGLTKWVKVAVVCSIVAFVYSIIKNQSVASGVSTLLSIASKFGF